MPTGERGFTYLWLLFALALSAALLAVAGQRWSLVTQRDREQELVFRGREIAAALAAYRAATEATAASGPLGMNELLEDRRGARLLRHLRRAYDDPFTGKPDWVPILAEDGSWRGVRSRSQMPALLHLEDEAPPADPTRTPRVCDHLFIAPQPRTPAASASAAEPPAQVQPDRP
jgi:type II secretory pathway pseudopilin PulG